MYQSVIKRKHCNKKEQQLELASKFEVQVIAQETMNKYCTSMTEHGNVLIDLYKNNLPPPP